MIDQLVDCRCDRLAFRHCDSYLLHALIQFRVFEIVRHHVQTWKVEQQHLLQIHQQFFARRIRARSIVNHQFPLVFPSVPPVFRTNVELARISHVLRSIRQQRVLAGKVGKELHTCLAEPPRVVVDHIGVDARSDPLACLVCEHVSPEIVGDVQWTVLAVLHSSAVECLVGELDGRFRGDGDRTLAEDGLRCFVLRVPVLSLVGREEDGDASQGYFPRGIDTVGVEHGESADGEGVVLEVATGSVESVSRKTFGLIGRWHALNRQMEATIVLTQGTDNLMPFRRRLVVDETGNFESTDVVVRRFFIILIEEFDGQLSSTRNISYDPLFILPYRRGRIGRNSGSKRYLSP